MLSTLKFELPSIRPLLLLLLAQAVVPVMPGDTADTLAARVLTQEHLIYPKVVAQLLSR
jgi:folate-dependent phosphoribosylglycinamide formyltransferase PurN